MAFTVALLAFAAPVGSARDTTHDAEDGQLPTDSRIQAARAALDDSGLNEDQRKQASEYLDEALRRLELAGAAREKLKRVRERVEGAPKAIEAARNAARVAEGELPDESDGDMAALEARAEKLQVELSGARERLKAADRELSSLVIGARDLIARVAGRSSELARLEAEVAVLPDPPRDLLEQARGWSLVAKRDLTQSELDVAQVRLDNQDTLSRLARAEQELASAKVARLTAVLEGVNQVLGERRIAEARDARREAEDMSRRGTEWSAPLQTLAEDTAMLRADQERVVATRQQLERELTADRSRLSTLRGDLDSDRRRVAVVGASDAIGRMLRRRRDGLPDVRALAQTVADRHDAISSAADRQVELHESQQAPENVLALAAEDTATRQEAKQLVRAHAQALADLEQAYGVYLTQVGSLELAERELIEVTVEYRDFIDDQLFEIRGPGLWSAETPARLLEGIAWGLSPLNWTAVGMDLLALVHAQPFRLLILAALFLTLLKNRRRARARLVLLARSTYRIRSDNFLLTLEALGLTLALAFVWPLPVIGIGWPLGQLGQATDFTRTVAAGLVTAGLLLAGGSFLWQLCRTSGLADRHLRWFPPFRIALQREMVWAVPVAVPLGFVMSLAADADLPAAQQAFGQIAFIALMGVWTTFNWRLFHRNGPVMTALRDQGKMPVMRQLHFLWFPAGLLLPLLMGLLSFLGYQVLALQINLLVEQSFWLLLGLWILRDLLLRYLTISERRLRLDEALRRREELKAHRAAGSEAVDEESAAVSDEEELDVDLLSEQARRVVRVAFLFCALAGVWLIWSELLASLDIFRQTSIPLTGSENTGGEGDASALTLGGALFAGLLLGVTLLATKNIPGVLEIALLQRLPLDAGARYTVKTLIQYLIAGVGLVVALGSLGLQWDKIQWLVAALGVGLGFGLQEIVANFISGIILLFERPIRVGDVVTLDGTTGVVSRIHIRATAITNYDKQELLIPNKEFITGRVVNWTLTDKVNRIVITVGVAYGSDVERAMALMLEAARENENVLDEPNPIASFEGFGDNSLNLLLRSFLGAMDNRLATITALHKAINAKFEQAGVVIAFPQRDLHLDTARPLDIRLHRGGGGRGQEEDP
jgi:potassium efflux system protein